MTRTPTRTIEIELLALDLDTCGRCTGTDRNLEAALDSVAHILRETGAGVHVTKRVVTTAEDAVRLRFASSPTIRIDGRDIALETRESSCKDCADLCGCEGGVDCRVWVWEGQEHLEAPKAMIVDAVLRAYAAPAPAPGASSPVTPFPLPENLRAYFAASEAAASPAAAAGDDCCDRSTCCEAGEKEACCGAGAGSGGACGCQ